jgi:hypothetical protein
MINNVVSMKAWPSIIKIPFKFPQQWLQLQIVVMKLKMGLMLFQEEVECNLKNQISINQLS